MGGVGGEVARETTTPYKQTRILTLGHAKINDSYYFFFLSDKCFRTDQYDDDDNYEHHDGGGCMLLVLVVVGVAAEVVMRMIIMMATTVVTSTISMNSLVMLTLRYASKLYSIAKYVNLHECTQM